MKISKEKDIKGVNIEQTLKVKEFDGPSCWRERKIENGKTLKREEAGERVSKGENKKRKRDREIGN